jgi:hypothetical protein
VLAEMGRQVAVVLYVVAMAAVIVGVDFVFFRKVAGLQHGTGIASVEHDRDSAELGNNFAQISRQLGYPFDRPAAVWRRYGGRRPEAKRAI